MKGSFVHYISSLVFVWYVFAVNGDLTSDIAGKLNTNLATVAVQKGLSIEELSKKTAEEILKLISPSLSLQNFKDSHQLSTPLQNLLKSKSIAQLLQYYKGFDMVPGMPEYKVSIMLFLQMASSFDSPGTTMTVLQSLKMICGQCSIGEILKTTDAALLSRRYLSDVYPVLLSNVSKILNETRESFFTRTTKLPEKYFKSLFKDPTIFEGLLTARKNMATAIIRGSSTEIQAASSQMQASVQKMTGELAKFASKSVTMKGMHIVDATTKCNLSINELETKTLMQVSLKCLGLPDGLPLLEMMPGHYFPKEVMTTPLNGISKLLKIPFNDLIKFTWDGLIAKFMQAERDMPALNEPIFYVAKQYGLSVTNMHNNTILNISLHLSKLNASNLLAVSNISSDTLNEMRVTTLDQLPYIVEKISGVEYPVSYFYFLSLNSIMKILNKNLSTDARTAASEIVSVPVNDVSNEEIAKIFGKTKAEIGRMSLLNFVCLVSDKDEQTIQKTLMLSPSNIELLRRVSLKNAEELYREFDIAPYLVLNRASVIAISKNPLFAMLLTSVRRMFGTSDASLMDSTISQINSKHPAIKHIFSLAAQKMGVKKTIIDTLTINDVKFAIGLTKEQFLNKTIFGLLKDLAKLSKDKIPSPDFDVTIRQLSERRGIQLSTLDGLSLLQMIKRVTNSSWQVPLVIRLKKGDPSLNKHLKNTSFEIRTMLENVIPRYTSYNFTISTLLTNIVGMDNSQESARHMKMLGRFLKSNLGIKDKFPLGIDLKKMEHRRFLSESLPVLLKSLEKLKTKTYVKQYFENTYNIPADMYDLLISEADGDIKEKVYQFAKDMLLHNHHNSINLQFQMQDLADKLGRRFAKRPFKDIIRVCKIKSSSVSNLKIKQIYSTCFNQSTDDFVQSSLNTTKLFRPFFSELPLTEIKDIMGLGLNYLNGNLQAVLNRETESKYGALFIPLKDVFAKAKFTQAEMRNLSLINLFSKQMFKHFNSNEYLQRNFVYGNNLKFFKEHTFQELKTAVGGNDKEFARTSAYDIMKKSIEILKNDPKKCEKLTRISNLCNKWARCVVTQRSYTCRCEGGFDGDGFRTCIDKCASKKCPSDSVCITLPGVGAVCKCAKRWLTMRNGKCQQIRGRLIKVKKLKLKQEYKKEYADKNSKAFKAKAAEIEDALFNTVCKRLGCIAVIVTSIEKGSLEVGFSVVLSSSNVTASNVEAVVSDAVDSPELAVLSPDKETKPQAQQSDACHSGVAECGRNENCLPTEKGSYTCTCNKGFERKNGECKSAGGISFVVIIIIIAVAFVLIVSVIAFFIWRWKRNRSENSTKYSMAYSHNDNERVQLTGGDYAFSYGEDKETGHHEKREEVA